LTNNVFEVFDQIEAQQRQLAANEPAPANALDFLQSIYRNPLQPLPVRIRCAVEALPFESAKLTATALLTSDDFATLLDKAIERSNGARVINHRPQETESRQ
jgi:hypothetical protein